MAQDLVLSSFECLLGWKWHSFFGQPFLVLNYPHGENYLPNIKWISLAAVCAHCLSSSQCVPHRRLLLLNCGKQKHLPLAFSSWDWTNPALPVSLQTSCAPVPQPPGWSRCSLSMNFLNWGTPERTQYSSCGFTSVEQKRRMTSLDLLAILLLIQPSTRLVFATVAHCCHTFSLRSTRTPRCLSEKLFSRQSTILNCCTRLFHSTWRTWHLPLLIVTKLLSVHFSHCQGPSE